MRLAGCRVGTRSASRGQVSRGPGRAEPEAAHRPGAPALAYHQTGRRPGRCSLAWPEAPSSARPPRCPGLQPIWHLPRGCRDRGNRLLLRGLLGLGGNYVTVAVRPAQGIPAGSRGKSSTQRSRERSPWEAAFCGGASSVPGISHFLASSRRTSAAGRPLSADFQAIVQPLGRRAVSGGAPAKLPGIAPAGRGSSGRFASTGTSAELRFVERKAVAWIPVTDGAHGQTFRGIRRNSSARLRVPCSPLAGPPWKTTLCG